MLSSSLRIFGGRGDGIGQETPFTPKAHETRWKDGFDLNVFKGILHDVRMETSSHKPKQI